MTKQIIKTCRLLLAAVLVSILLLAMIPVGNAQAANKCGDYEYNVLKDGTVEIVRYYNLSYDGHLVIPEIIEGYTVSSIGTQAFEWCKATTIVIPDTVTVIKRYAFSSCDMKSIKLSKNLKTIEEYAFYGSNKLERLEFPDGLLEIGDQAFFGCDEMDCLIVPSGLQDVGWQVFGSKSPIENVYFKGTQAEWDTLNFFASNVASQTVAHCDFNLQSGDVNGDNVKNMLDVMWLYSSISGQTNLESVYMMLSDINDDALLNMTDLMELYNQIAGK